MSWQSVTRSISSVPAQPPPSAAVVRATAASAEARMEARVMGFIAVCSSDGWGGRPGDPGREPDQRGHDRANVNQAECLDLDSGTAHVRRQILELRQRVLSLDAHDRLAAVDLDLR